MMNPIRFRLAIAAILGMTVFFFSRPAALAAITYSQDFETLAVGFDSLNGQDSWVTLSPHVSVVAANYQSTNWIDGSNYLEFRSGAAYRNVSSSDYFAFKFKILGDQLDSSYQYMVNIHNGPTEFARIQTHGAEFQAYCAGIGDVNIAPVTANVIYDLKVIITSAFQYRDEVWQNGNLLASHTCGQYNGGGFTDFDRILFYNPSDQYLNIDDIVTTDTGGPPLILADLRQYKSDATTPIDEGGTTTENTVVFQATLNSSSTNNQLRLDLELATSTANFTGTPTATSTPVSPGSFATTTISNLDDGSYFWRARAVDITTNAASSWQEFGTTGNMDFVLHQVPLYTQIDPQWAQEIYADGLGNNPNDPGKCGQFIRNCGCAITSAVMVLRYYDITTAVDGFDVRPPNINGWLLANNGYDHLGNLDWSKVQEYSKPTLTSLSRMHLDSRRDFASAQQFTIANTNLNNYLTSAKPVILKVKIPAGGGGLAMHYIVADGALASTYTVKDPLLYSTKKLDTLGGDDLQNHIRAYNNQFYGERLYSFFATGTPIDNLSIHIASPADIVVTDPRGRRVGLDPISNILYAEIPNASYGDDGISDVSVANPTSSTETKTVFVPQPLGGNYNVRVIGTGSGSYTLSALSYDVSSMPHEAMIVASTTPNQVADYTLNFTTSTTATTTLTLSTLVTTTINAWIGLKNSDDVGIKFDLEADILKNGVAIASGTLASIPGGSSGFNNAHLYSVPINMSTPATFSAGDALSVKLLVRNACTGSGHNSGTARLWYGDSGANSNSSPIVTNSQNYFLDGNNTLVTATGTLRQTTDVSAGAKCSPYKSMGTWSIAF